MSEVYNLKTAGYSQGYISDGSTKDEFTINTDFIPITSPMSQATLDNLLCYFKNEAIEPDKYHMSFSGAVGNANYGTYVYNDIDYRYVFFYFTIDGYLDGEQADNYLVTGLAVAPKDNMEVTLGEINAYGNPSGTTSEWLRLALWGHREHGWGSIERIGYDKLGGLSQFSLDNTFGFSVVSNGERKTLDQIISIPSENWSISGVSIKQTNVENMSVSGVAKLYGYETDDVSSEIFATEFLPMPYTFDFTEYPNARYFRVEVKRDLESDVSQRGMIVPIHVTASTLTGSGVWMLGEDDKLTNLWLGEEIQGDNFTPPYPASFWYYDRRLRRLNNMLLPDELHSHSGISHDYTDGTEYFNTYTEKYINALKNKYNTYRIRLELLTDDETAIGEITKDLSLSAQGQITINYEKITRRSCSLTLINVEKKYIPTKNSPFWLNRKFKLWIGLVVDTDTYWWSEGVYYTVSAHATGRTLEIEGIDKGGALDGTLKLNMTESQYKFGHNVLISEIIKRTLSLDVGSPVTGIWAKPMVYGGNRPIDSVPPLISAEYFGFKTVSDITVDANNYISSLFEQLADLYAADCYYDTEGHFVFEPHIDSSGYNYVPTQWKFDDLSSTFEEVEYEYSFDGENVVTVYTNTTSAGVANVSWTAYNTNPLSPLNVGTGMRRGEHIEIPYYDNTTPEQMVKDCRSAANHYLLAKSMVGMTLAFNSPIIPHMDVNKTIMINDQYADIEDGLYVVQSITIPLSGDKMSIEATNINWLPNDMRFSGISEIVEKSEGGAG